MTEYSNTYHSEDGTEVEIKIKAECPTQDGVRKALSFMAQSSHRFYLETAEKIIRTKRCLCKCGKEWHRPEAIFCYSCGAKLNDEAGGAAP